MEFIILIGVGVCIFWLIMRRFNRPKTATVNRVYVERQTVQGYSTGQYIFWNIILFVILGVYTLITTPFIIPNCAAIVHFAHRGFAGIHPWIEVFVILSFGFLGAFLTMTLAVYIVMPHKIVSARKQQNQPILPRFVTFFVFMVAIFQGYILFQCL